MADVQSTDTRLPQAVVPLPPDVWEATPPAARALILVLLEQVSSLQKRLDALEEQIRTNSTNSSKPPSSDPPGSLPRRKQKSGRPKGGQPGHEGHHRALVPSEKADHILQHYPRRCSKCSRELTAADAANESRPVRHQVWELPPVRAEVTEHQLHRCCCPDCGAVSLAELPIGVVCVPGGGVNYQAQSSNTSRVVGGCSGAPSP